MTFCFSILPGLFFGLLKNTAINAQTFGLDGRLFGLLARIKRANAQASELAFVAAHGLAYRIQLGRLQAFDGFVDIRRLRIDTSVEVVLACNQLARGGR